MEADFAKLENELLLTRRGWLDAQRKLDDVRQLLTDFLNYNPALSFIKDESGRYLYASRSFAEFFKVDPADFLGKTDYEWLPEQLARHFTDNDDHVRDSGVPFETIESVPFENGTIHSMVYKFPIITPSGKRYLGGIAVDITQRKAAEDLSAQLSSIVEFSRDAIIGRTLDGIISSWNRGAETIFGFTSREMIGNPISILVPPEFRSPNSRTMQVLNLGELMEHFETEGLRKDGGKIFVSLTISPIHNSQGKLIGSSVIARDATKKKQAEEKIVQLHLQLECRIEELARANQALEQARDEALQASKVKSAFLAVVSHELRTPLSAIISANELLMVEHLSDDQRGLATIVHDSASALLLMVNDLLDVSAIESGTMLIYQRPFDPALVVRETVQTLFKLCHEKRLDLHLQLDPNMPEIVVGDCGRLKQVLSKLLGNAIKFTEQGSVTVSGKVLQLRKETATIRFAVEDTGIGISAADQQRLFLPFSQVESGSTRKFEGTGLGLSISKSLVELMGGKIELKSEVGNGSTFLIDLTLPRTAVTSQ
jgi:PAS domain S-box-containing protein